MRSDKSNNVITNYHKYNLFNYFSIIIISQRAYCLRLVFFCNVVYAANTKNIFGHLVNVLKNLKMCDDLKLLKQGAEAKLYICNYLGKPTLIKERFKKTYRHSDLDVALTKERIKNEARAIVRSKAADVKTPTLYLVDFDRRRIYMQHFQNSITVKDFIITIFKLESDPTVNENIQDVLTKKIGNTIRKLHDNNIIHGDLTTSNMLLVQKSDSPAKEAWLNVENLDLVMIDFGLSHIDSSAEDKGVDLYVLERAIISTHNDYPHLFGMILDAYKGYSKKNVKEIISKFEEVRARGRKRTMVG